jgi:hypothetical protein
MNIADIIVFIYSRVLFTEEEIVQIILVSIPRCYMLHKVQQLRIPVKVMPLFINQLYTLNATFHFTLVRTVNSGLNL